MNKKQREIYINLINGEINKFEEKNIKEKNNLTEKIASSLSCYYQGYGKSRKVKEVYFLESIELLNNLEKDITNEFDIELLQELRILGFKSQVQQTDAQRILDEECDSQVFCEVDGLVDA